MNELMKQSVEVKKTCSKCKVEKELSCFNKKKCGKYGVSSYCKQCQNEYGMVYNKSHSVEYNPNAFKVCGICKLKKSTTDFSKNKYGKFGVASQCKECQNEIKIEYYENNKESCIEKSKDYRNSNSEKISESRRKYRENNKEKINERQKKTRANNSLFKLRCNIGSLIRYALLNGYKNNTKTANILGCDYETFKNHIENQFEDWMSWENYGKYNGELNFGWEIDHRILVSRAKNEVALLMLNHYTNLRPLCSKLNRSQY